MAGYSGALQRKQGGKKSVVPATKSMQFGATVYTGAQIEAMFAIIAAIPTADQEDSATIWNDQGVLKVSTSGG